MLYGDNKGQGLQGEWSAEADEWIADRPEYLANFVEARKVRCYSC